MTPADISDPAEPRLRLRAAKAEDAELVLAFIHELAEYERLSEHVTATPDDIARTLFGADPAAEVWIADWDETPAGFALFFRSYSTFIGCPGIYLEDLFVRPDFRGRGIGWAMLKSLAAEVRRRGFARLDWVVLDWNRPAIDFYHRIGARPLDDWRHFRLDGDALARLADEANRSP